MPKAYIAAPIFDGAQLGAVEAIKALCETIGYDVFSPYHASEKVWRGRKPADCSPREREIVLMGNIENIDTTDLMVAWLGGTDLAEHQEYIAEANEAAADQAGARPDTGPPYMDPKRYGKTDTGVAWEMGYATALRRTVGKSWNPKPTILGFIHEDDVRQGKNVNLMLAGTMDGCVLGFMQLSKALGLFFNESPKAMIAAHPLEHLIGHEE